MICNLKCFRCQDDTITIYPADVVLFEGILVFYFPAIRDLFHMKLFVDTDSDTRLARRGKIGLFIELLRSELCESDRYSFLEHLYIELECLNSPKATTANEDHYNFLMQLFFFYFAFSNIVPRDINERGRDLDQVLTQYMTFVKPAFEEFCSPVSTLNSLCNLI